MSTTNGNRVHHLADSYQRSVGQAKQISAENTNALAQTFTCVLELHIPPLQRAVATTAQAHNALLARIEYLESRTLRGRWIRFRLWVMNRATSYVARRQHAECVLLVGGPLNARRVLASRLAALSPTNPVHRVTMPTGPAAMYRHVEQRDNGGRRCFAFVGFEAPDATADDITTQASVDGTPVDAPTVAATETPARAD